MIAGGPRSGKSTLAAVLSRGGRVRVRGSDELMQLGWSESSLVASSWFEYPGPWICEGVVMPRAVRKWLAANPGDEKPFDRAIWMNDPVHHRNTGQSAMAKGCDTVWREVIAELERREVRIINV